MSGRPRRAALATALLTVALFGASPATAHNAAHAILPDGRCVEVGSNREAPLIGSNATQDPADRVQLDLIAGPGDQYGARYAAVESPTLLPGNCPAP